MTNCFSINIQVFTNNSQHDFIKIHFEFVVELKKQKAMCSHWPVTITSERANLDQSEYRKINSHLEIYTERK